jgi:hypothetical protein
MGSRLNTDRHLQDEVCEELEDAFRSTRTLAVLGYEELGGLLDPDAQDCTCGMLLLGYRMGYV